MKTQLLSSQYLTALRLLAISIIIIPYYSVQCQAIIGEGNSSQTGVKGTSLSGTGVDGRSEMGVGVYAYCQDGFGVLGVSPNKTGVYGNSYNGNAVEGLSTNRAGVFGTSFSSFGVSGIGQYYHGAFFQGNKENGFADIILGASSDSGVGDNGIIRSDPDVPTSDIFLQANDAVVARIDYNNNGLGNFFVYGQNGVTLFQVSHDGTVSATSGFIQNSDRYRKEQIQDVSYAKILSAIDEMPIYEWQYKGQDRRHIGPMAQDFHKAFNLGEDDKSIAAIDADGVALAAIKAQQEIIEEQKSEINILNKKVSDLEFIREEILNMQKIQQQEIIELKKQLPRKKFRRKVRLGFLPSNRSESKAPKEEISF